MRLRGGAFRPPSADRARTLLAVASLGVGAGAAALVVHRSGVGLGAVLRGPPPAAHALALLAFVLELAARGLRVRLTARGLGRRLPLAAAVRAQLAADAVGAVTPSRIGADAAKLGVLTQAGIEAGPAAALLLAEAASEALLLLFCSLLVVSCTDSWWIALGPLLYAAVVTSSGAVALLTTRRTRPDPPRWWRKVGLKRSRWRALRRAARSFHEHVGALRRVPLRWTAAVFGAAFVHLAARLALLPALALAVPGASASFAELVLRPFFVLYATSLLPPPGGGGGVEVAFTALLHDRLSVSALAPALVWWRVYTFYLPALLGWLDLGARRLVPTRGWIHALHLRFVAFLR